MPCYLFTWHAYGSWLPDHPNGHTHWSRGYEPTNVALALRYRQQQKEPTVKFTAGLQREIIEELRQSSTQQHCRLHYVATDLTHLHALVSWQDNQSWQKRRRALRRSLSLHLNQRGHRKWFSRGGAPKQVKTQNHFSHLVTTYLPKHQGWKWCEHRNLFK